MCIRDRRRQRQEDDDEREGEGDDKARGFLDVLPHLAAVIDRIALRQGSLGQAVEIVDRIGLRHAGRHHALDGGGVELLEVIQRFRNGVGLDGGDGGERHRGAVGGFDVVVQDLIGVETIDLLHLRDHLIGCLLYTSRCV